MARDSVKRAFTLIELLVVVAIIALLISILLPSLQGAREQGKKAVCLTNLKQIAQASHSYAVDDAREQIIPVHQYKVLSWGYQGFTGPWAWRLALPFVYGGRTSVKPIQADTTITVMTDSDGTNPSAHWKWGAASRPLNRYVYGDMSEGDFKNLPMYRCPSDIGYPEFNPDDWGGLGNVDCHPKSALIPCYDMLGNSYRVNTCGLVWLNQWSQGGTSPQYKGFFSVGAEGHASSAIEYPGRTVLYPEPRFYWWSRQDPGTTPNVEKLLFPGWHKMIMGDNVSYCDGSARLTKVDLLAEWDQKTLDDMNYTPDFDPFYFLRRGRTWQTDCYPSPGALGKVFLPSGQAYSGVGVSQYSGWPFDNYTTNLPPF